jgi:hypothetical protein
MTRPKYVQQFPGAYQQLAKAAQGVTGSSANVKVLDLYTLYQSFEPTAFQGPVSLTDEAQTVLADRLYAALVSQLALQPKPYGEF